MNRILPLLLTLLVFSGHAFGRLSGRAKIDSLLKVLANAKQDTNKVNILTNLSFTYGNIDPDKGIGYGLQALKLADELNFDKGLANANNSLHQNYLCRAEYDTALKYVLRSLEINERLGNKRSVAVNLGNIANIYQGQSNFSRALEYQFRALKIKEELKNKELIATSLMNIGNIYMEMGNFPKQFEYHTGALRLNEELANKEGITQCYMNLGNSYYLQKNYQAAIDYFIKALQYAEEMGVKLQIQRIKGNLGSTYLAIHNYPLALEYSFNGLKMCQETGDREGVAYEQADIGATYLALAKVGTVKNLPDSLARLSQSAFLQRAIYYLSSAIESDKGVNNLVFEYEAFKYLSEAYALAGDTKNALEKYKEYTRLKDSVFSQDSKVKVARLETEREAGLKEKQIEINKLAQAEKKREMLVLWGGIALLSVVTVVVIRANNKQKKANEVSNKLRANLEVTLGQKNILMKEIEEAANMKSKFLANISHELRTPVTLLTGMLELVKSSSDEANANKLEIAYHNSRRLQRMVEELLDLSKLERSESKLKRENKEILPLLRRMVYSFSSLIEQEKLTLHFTENNAGKVCVLIDEERLENIISNLVYNAIKFNRAGGYINVTISTSEDKRQVQIEVADSGVGIDEKDLPHIFERFYQSDSSGAKAKGAGIGLSVVKEYTEALGGSVTVTSKSGVGTTFILQFPIADSSDSENSEAEEAISLPVTCWEHFENRQSILIVEDNTDMRYYLREILSERVNIAEAENGKRALSWLENNEPDLIITDIMMPEMDGREFIAVLKDSEKYKRIPVITVSALADLESQLATLRLGIDDYIVKPFNPIELQIRVYNLLNNLRERKLFNAEDPEPDDIPVDSKQADEFRAKINELVLARIKNFNVTVFDLAYEFSLSERQMYRLAKSLTGCTPAQLIKEARLQKAYEMLLNGEVRKVETLAKAVGFDNINYFSKQFLERFGKRPAEFL